MTRPPTASPAQRVCPHCARIAHTDARRCPFCRRSYRRRILPWVALMLVVFAAGILGGIAAMLTAFGDRVDDELDSRVTTVQRQLTDQIQGIGDDVVTQLEQKLQQQGVTP